MDGSLGFACLIRNSYERCATLPTVAADHVSDRPREGARGSAAGRQRVWGWLTLEWVLRAHLGVVCTIASCSRAGQAGGRRRSAGLTSGGDATAEGNSLALFRCLSGRALLSALQHHYRHRAQVRKEQNSY